jgi:hypothetical protein
MDIIEGPIEGHGHAGVTDLDSYLEIHSRRMAKMEKSISEVDESVTAYINHGRWVVNCECNGAGLTSPDFKISCCFDCGRRYVNIVFPKNAKKIENELLKRREATNRNWTDEPLKVLALER